MLFLQLINQTNTDPYRHTLHNETANMLDFITTKYESLHKPQNCLNFLLDFLLPFPEKLNIV